jgi:hypothetical protein
MPLLNAPIRVLVATATCALMAAAPAAASPADQFPPGGPDMTRAYEQATGYWQGSPCGGQVRIAWATMGREYNAIARWTALDPSRPDTFYDCSITFNTAQPYDYPMLCSVMAHEIGHLLGKPHGGEQRGSVMSETYYGPVGPCGPGALPEPPPDEEWDAEEEPATTARRASAASKRRCVKRLRAKRVTARAAAKRCSSKKRSTSLR